MIHLHDLCCCCVDLKQSKSVWFGCGEGFFMKDVREKTFSQKNLEFCSIPFICRGFLMQIPCQSKIISPWNVKNRFLGPFAHLWTVFLSFCLPHNLDGLHEKPQKINLIEVFVRCKWLNTVISYELNNPPTYWTTRFYWILFSAQNLSFLLPYILLLFDFNLQQSIYSEPESKKVQAKWWTHVVRTWVQVRLFGK